MTLKKQFLVTLDMEHHTYTLTRLRAVNYADGDEILSSKNLSDISRGIKKTVAAEAKAPEPK